MTLDRKPETRPAANAAAPVVGGDPLVTVVLPVFGRDQFLDQAIQSVLGQTHRNVQLIVVDDGSPVDPVPRAARFLDRIEFYRKANGGPASARNFGMARAKGDFLLFLDDDDYLEPRAVEALLKPIDGRPDVVWVAGRLAYRNECGELLPQFHPCSIQSRDVYADMIRHNLIGTPSSVLLRTEVVRALGGFDENPRYQFCEDYDLWLTMARDFPIVAIPEVVSNYRYHAGNATRQWARHFPAWLATLEKHRQRARPGLEPVFQLSAANVHLNFGDELYVHGRHAEARKQWRQGAKADPQLRRGLVWRYSKSFLPAGLVRVLRGLQRHASGVSPGS
jgi:GT2 family glycosyltransferase